MLKSRSPPRLPGRGASGDQEAAAVGRGRAPVQAAGRADLPPAGDTGAAAAPPPQPAAQDLPTQDMRQEPPATQPAAAAFMELDENPAESTDGAAAYPRGARAKRGGNVANRLAEVERRLDSIEEAAAWTSSALASMQLQESLRTVRVVGLPAMDRSRIERLLASWTTRGGITASSIAVQQSFAGDLTAVLARFGPF